MGIRIALCFCVGELFRMGTEREKTIGAQQINIFILSAKLARAYRSHVPSFSNSFEGALDDPTYAPNTQR